MTDGHEPKSICLLRILSQLHVGGLNPVILAGAAERGEQGSRSFIPQPTFCQRTLKADYRDEVPYRKTSKKLGFPILIYAFRPKNEFSRTDYPILLDRSNARCIQTLPRLSPSSAGRVCWHYSVEVENILSAVRVPRRSRPYPVPWQLFLRA